MARTDLCLVKVIQEAQRSFCVTDPRQPDNPIVWASDAFLRMTEVSELVELIESGRAVGAGVDASALEGGGGRISNSQIFPFFNQTRGPAKGQVAGSICQGVSGFSDKRHSLVAESITTGNIELVVLPPVDPELMGSS